MLRHHLLLTLSLLYLANLASGWRQGVDSLAVYGHHVNPDDNRALGAFISLLCRLFFACLALGLLASLSKVVIQVTVELGLSMLGVPQDIGI